MYMQLGSRRRRSGFFVMYDKIVLEFDDNVVQGWLDADYFRAGWAGGNYMTKKKHGWSHNHQLKQHGILQVYLQGGTLYRNLAIRYTGKGCNKDVYSVTLKNPEDGSEVRAVMKVMASKWYEALEVDVKQALDPRVAGMMPQQFGLYKDVQVITIEAGQTRRRSVSFEVCVQLEADCGEDVALQFDSILRGEGHDRIGKALDLWNGAIKFWLEWQLTEGRGKQEEHNFLMDMHNRNICRLVFALVFVCWSLCTLV